MRLRFIASVICAGLAALLVAGGPAAAQPADRAGSAAAPAGSAAAPAAPANWLNVTGMVLGLSRVSAGNIWATGQFEPNKADTRFDTVAHWNGRRWTVVVSPLLTQANEDDDGNTTSLAAISNTDVWAANTNGILHWNGRSWRVSYKTPPNSAGIDLVAAGSARNVWAAGSSYTNTGNAVLNFYHWTGSAWFVVPTPFPATNDKYSESIDAIAVTGGTAWAFGDEQRYLGPSTEYPLLLRWTGTQWKVYRFPIKNGTDQIPQAAAVGPHGTVWAVGIGMREGLYWTGKQWRSAAIPAYSNLAGVAAIPGGTAWAAGVGAGALIAHWADNRWNAVRLPGGLPLGVGFTGVAAFSGANAWAAGMSGLCDSAGDCRTIILHWNGKAWS